MFIVQYQMTVLINTILPTIKILLIIYQYYKLHYTYACKNACDSDPLTAYM